MKKENGSIHCLLEWVPFVKKVEQKRKAKRSGVIWTNVCSFELDLFTQYFLFFLWKNGTYLAINSISKSHTFSDLPWSYFKHQRVLEYLSCCWFWPRLCCLLEEEEASWVNRLGALVSPEAEGGKRTRDRDHPGPSNRKGACHFRWRCLKTRPEHDVFYHCFRKRLIST